MIFVFTILFFSCQPKKKSYPILEILVPKYPEPIYLFSFPGREVDEPKKRVVLDHILKRINDSKFQIQVYAYSLNHPEILDALKRAKEKGVELSFLLDSEKEYSELKELGFPIKVWKESGLQHIKAMVFDKTFLFLGTGNFSRYGLTHDWNGYIDIPLSETEYEDIIGELELRKSNYLLFLSKFQFLFSPQNGKLIQNFILDAIEKTQYSVKVLSFDHFDVIFSHVLKEASARSVQVEMVHNRPLDAEGKYLAEEIFVSRSQIYTDGNTDRVFEEGNPFPEGGLLHHKTILIDNEILLTGSYNYSQSARDKNREIFLVTKDKKAVEEFKMEFDRIKNKSYPETMIFYNPSPKIESPQEGEFPFFCEDQPIAPGVYEMGEGIFHSYLYFSSESNCIDFRKKHSISTGYSSFFSSPGKEFPLLWKEYNFFPRLGAKRFLQKNFKSLKKATPLEIEFVKREGLKRSFRIKNAGENKRFLLIANRSYTEIETNESGEFFLEPDTDNWEQALLVSNTSEEADFVCLQKKDNVSQSLSFLLGQLWLKTEYLKERPCYKIP